MLWHRKVVTHCCMEGAQVVAHERLASPALLIKSFSKIRWGDKNFFAVL